jgi:hypothetical protein
MIKRRAATAERAQAAVKFTKFTISSGNRESGRGGLDERVRTTRLSPSCARERNKWRQEKRSRENRFGTHPAKVTDEILL